MGSAVEELQKALAANGAFGSAAPSSSPPVFMGQASATGHGGDDLIAGMGRTPADSGSKPHKSYTTTDDAYLIPYQSDATREGLGQQMYENGLIRDPNDFAAINKMWQMAVDQAATFQQAGRDLTPWEVLDVIAGKSGVKKDAVPKNRTTTQTSTSLPNAEDLARVVEAVYKDNVGRAPNPSELAKYTALLTNQAKANPTKTTTTTQYGADGSATSSNSVTKQGADASTLAYQAQKELQDTKEFGAQQAGVYYWNALVGALGAGGG